MAAAPAFATATPSTPFLLIDDDRLAGLPIAEWGMDQQTWTAVKNKKGLIKLAANGEEEHFKRRMEIIKKLIASAPAKPAAAKQQPAAKAAEAVEQPAAAEKKKRSKPRKGRRAKAMLIPGFQETRRTSGPYVLYGECPATLDQTAIEALVEERAAFKAAKDFASADAVREKLTAMNVKVRDDFRTWSVA